MKTHWKKLTAMLIAAMLTFNMAGHAVVSFADDLVTNSPITDSAEGNDDPALDPDGNGQQTPADPNGNGQQTPTDPNGNGQQTPTDPNGNGQQIPTDPNGNGQQTPTDPNGNGQQTPTDPNGNGQQTPTDPNGNGQQTPTDPNGNGQQTPTDPNGNGQQTPVDSGSSMNGAENGIVVPLEDTENVCMFGDVEYPSLQEAVSAVITSPSKTGTVTLLKDCEGSGIGLFNGKGHVDVNLTIDFGGHTYTLSGESVGSTGTESQGFHFEKNNTVTLKNGNVQVAESESNFKMLVQNYCDLTLKDISLEGNSSTQYIISVNYGDVTLDNVNIYSLSNNFVAIDLMHWTNASYKDKAPTMVINNGTNNHINGNIDVYCDPDTDCEEKPTLTISGGTYTVDPTPYLADGYSVNKNADNTYTVVPSTPVVPDPDPQPTPDPTPDTKPDTTPDTTPSRPSNNDRYDDDDTTTTVVTKPSTTTNQNKVEVVTKDDTTTATTKVPTKVQDETLTATVSESVLEEAVDKALETAEKKDTAPVVEINLGSSVDVSTMNVTLATDSLETLAENEDAQLVLTSPVATVKFDAEALQAIADQANGEVTLKVVPVETNELTAEQRAVVGDNLVIELLLVSDGTYISDFEGGNATVTIPYELKDGETAEGLVVYFIDNDGKLYECETSYDAVNKCITFITPHFSKYVVGYESDKVMGGNVAGTVAGNTNSSSSEKYNPSTGSSNMVSVMALAATLSLGGLVAFGRKKR